MSWRYSVKRPVYFFDSNGDWLLTRLFPMMSVFNLA